MAIADYTDLLVTCSEYSGRDDFAHMFPRFVKFAENKLNKTLRVADMEVILSITTSATGAAALPPDLQEIREVNTNTGRPIELSAVTALDDLYRFDSGTPAAYAIIGQTFYALPIAAATFVLTYYAKIPPLTVTAPTNWLLDDGPLMYLYAVLAEIEGWAVATGKSADPSRFQAVQQALQGEMGAFQIQDERRRWSNARVTLRSITP